MQKRTFSNTGAAVSEIGLGTWQLGSSDWGAVTEQQARETLSAAADAGVTFFDTADIYGGGESERRVGRFLAGRADAETLYVATKFGRDPEPGGLGNTEYAAMRRHAEGSIERLGVSRLWLTQGHCLSDEALKQGKVFGNLRRLQRDGLIEHFGMSVESVEQGLLCLDQDGLSSLQVIFNVFRQKLIDELFEKASARGVALIVRLPLASGLLAGKMTASHVFGESDHRSYNRDGQAFNAGETFAGVPFERGLELVEMLRERVPKGRKMAEWALRYCLDFPAVTTVIPGARNPGQVSQNVTASRMEPLSGNEHSALRQFYREHVHSLIRGVY
jgi:aryl-alcohol dehydrogenase-like predicted oxidoreductase